MYLLVRYEDGSCAVIKDGAAVLLRQGPPGCGEPAIAWGSLGPGTDRLALLLLLDHFGDREHAKQAAPRLAQRLLAVLPLGGFCLFDHHLEPYAPPVRPRSFLS